MRYGDHAEQVVDVTGDGPVVAVLHGGCWRARYDRSLTAAITREFAAMARACEYVELAGCGHMEHCDPDRPAWAAAVEWISARLPPGRGSRTAGSPRS